MLLLVICQKASTGLYLDMLKGMGKLLIHYYTFTWSIHTSLHNTEDTEEVNKHPEVQGGENKSFKLIKYIWPQNFYILI